jgi:hypothetical protein
MKPYADEMKTILEDTTKKGEKDPAYIKAKDNYYNKKKTYDFVHTMIDTSKKNSANEEITLKRAELATE